MMRILIVNSSIRKIAGMEDYLANIIPELSSLGHELAFAHEVDLPRTRERILLPEGAPSWDVSQLGRKRTLDRMKDWKPDLIYAHGGLDPRFVAGFLQIAPAVYFAHNYFGTCISGLKTFMFPIVRPCHRRFGPACLLYYFPRRCGGRNPITMFRLFFREAKRLASFHKYKAVITHSIHMREEYLRHGLPDGLVRNFVHEIAPARESLATAPVEASVKCETTSTNMYWRLLFVGRMELLKGGAQLLDAVELAAQRLDRPIRLVMVGEGSKREAWEKQAARVRSRRPALEVEFAGWLDKDRLKLRYSESDLLVVPSLWPEPFGRIGTEAGLHGVPVAAFAVGGIPDWLHQGVNGFLAPGDPPTVAGLSEAIVKCLENPGIYQQLRAGAVTIARQFTMDNHVRELSKAFDQACPQ